MLDMAFQLLTFFILTYHPMPVGGAVRDEPAARRSRRPRSTAEAPDRRGRLRRAAGVACGPCPRSCGPATAGSLAEITLGEQTMPTDPAALEKELDKYFQDPDLPFDQTLIKVDPEPHATPS